MNISEMQADQAAWFKRNWPANTHRTYWPILGMMEELQEFLEVGKNWEDAEDAIADAYIFALDYCNKRGWSMSAIVRCDTLRELQDQLKPLLPPTETDLTLTIKLMRFLGHLSHAHLKTEQGIRGSTDKHTEAGQIAISRFVNHLCLMSCIFSIDFDKLVNTTWDKVRQRVWNVDTGANPK